MNYYSMILLGQLNFYMEMLIPMLLLIRRQEKRNFFWLRLLPVVAAGAGFVFMPAVSVGPFGMNYLIVSSAVFLAGWFLFRLSPLDVLFYVVAAFAVQHGLWDVLFMIYEGIGEITQPVALVIYFSLYLVAYLLFYFFFPVSDFKKGGIKGRGLQFAVSCFIIAFVYVLASFVPWYDEWNMIYRLYALICCIFALGLQCGLFEHSKLKEKNKELEQDNAILQELLIREQKHYNITKDTIDLINVKCHDLKHQISVLRNMDEKERDKSLGEVEKAIMIYGNIAKTGNETLDIVLTEKSFLCESYRTALDENTGSVSQETVISDNAEDWTYTTQFTSTKDAVDSMKEFAIREAAESLVLLKNTNNSLPLNQDRPKVTLFGIRSYAPYYGSTTGGSIPDKGVIDHDPNKSTLETDFKEVFDVNPAMIQAYEDYCADFTWGSSGFGAQAPQYQGLYSTTDPTEPTLSELGVTRDELDYGNYSDAAIVILGRVSGEGSTFNPGEEGLGNGISTDSGNILGISDEEWAII